MAPRSFVLRVSAARTIPSRAAQQISLGKTQRTSIPHRHHYACGSAGKYRISPSGAGSSTAHALRRFTFVRRVTRTYSFYRTPPRGPTSVSLPSGRAVVPHSSTLASSVLSSPCQGLRFGLSPPVRCSCQTHSSATGCALRSPLISLRRSPTLHGSGAVGIRRALVLPGCRAIEISASSDISLIRRLGRSAQRNQEGGRRPDDIRGAECPGRLITLPACASLHPSHLAQRGALGCIAQSPKW